MDEYCKLAEKYLPDGIHCVFRSDIPVSRINILGAELHFLQKEIVFNEGWAKVLLFHENESIVNSFKLTVGHEYTHFVDRKVVIPQNTEKRTTSDSLDEPSNKFKNWLSEVHADFGGAKLALNADRQCAVHAQEAKKQWNDKLRGSDEEDVDSHPTMKKRIEYLGNYNFNEKLIRRIAKDVGCTNTAFINEMCKFYEGQEIILH